MKEFHNEGIMPPTFDNNNLSLPIRMRAWLSREPDPEYGGSFLIEARHLMREALADLERLQKLAAPVWPTDGTTLSHEAVETLDDVLNSPSKSAIAPADLPHEGECDG